jgi:hypothetical protein
MVLPLFVSYDGYLEVQAGQTSLLLINYSDLCDSRAFV